MKLFCELRKEMKKEKLKAEDIACLLCCSREHISHCLNGRADFKLSEIYKIMDFLKLPHESMHYYFPNGVSVDSKQGSFLSMAQ